MSRATKMFQSEEPKTPQDEQEQQLALKERERLLDEYFLKQWRKTIIQRATK